MYTNYDFSGNVLWVAESNFPKGSRIKPHSHNYYHLFYVRQGLVEFTTNTEKRLLHEGEFALIKPQETHEMIFHHSRVARCYEVKFVSSNIMLSSLPSFFEQNQFTNSIIQELVKESARSKSSSPMFAACFLRVLIIYLYRNFSISEETDSKFIETTGFSQVSKEIVNYLENNYQEDFSLQDVADAIGLNRTYICSVFKRDSGMTIGKCHTVIRIKKAAEAISFSDLNLSQVSSSLGFASLNHFNRVFKKVVGIPPGQYRRMYQAEIMVPGDSSVDSELIEYGGFIMSVLAGKKLTISDIMAQAEWLKTDDK